MLLYGPGTKYQIEEVKLDLPGENEVLRAVRGERHVPLSTSTWSSGDLVADPERTPGAVRQFPMIAGHEGAGVVEEAGPGVTELRPGDHVVTSFIRSCGTCPSCASGQQNSWAILARR